MSRDLFLAPTHEITFAEIEQLASSQAEEGPTLEFKETLSTSDGKPDRWFRDQSGVGRVARDDIAKEVVALANAYGGIVIVGIAETDDNPRRAQRLASPLMPRVVDCAEQLAQSLRDLVEPPLPQFEVRGIPRTAAGEGVVFIRIGSSPSAPHGFGRPAASYVRRGANSEPLTMRDLQSMFWESRTRIERIERRREEQSSAAKRLWTEWSTGRLLNPKPDTARPRSGPSILFRCSLFPLISMDISNFPDHFANSDARFPRPFGAEGNPVELPEWMRQWGRRYRAVEHEGNVGEQRYWRASIEADGVVSQIAIQSLTKGRVYLQPFARMLAQGMIITEWLRAWAKRPNIEYVLDGEFMCRNASIQTDPNWNESAPIAWERTSIGPYSVGNRKGFEQTFDSIEREMWDAFGVKRWGPLKFDVGDVFTSVGL
jgi:hypothetical protein